MEGDSCEAPCGASHEHDGYDDEGEKNCHERLSVAGNVSVEIHGNVRPFALVRRPPPGESLAESCDYFVAELVTAALASVSSTGEAT